MEEKNNNNDTVVKNMVKEAVIRLDDIREIETKRIEDKFKDIDTKYQIQFTAAEKAIAIASTAQEKLVAQALDGTKEAINKADIATDKRFELLSEKINGLSDTLNKNAGAQGIYVTHTDLQQSLDRLQTNIEVTLKPVVAFMNSAQGSGKGRQDMFGWIVAGITIIVSIFLFYK